MELPEAETPEEFFEWLRSRGTLTAEQAREAVAAVRADDAEETRWETRP